MHKEPINQTCIWSSLSLQEATGHHIPFSCWADRVVIDHRAIAAGSNANISTDTAAAVCAAPLPPAAPLFIGLPGIRFNGGDFAAAALERGAVLCFVAADSLGARLADPRVIIVPDPYALLDSLARYNRQRFGGKVVAVTGSCGKTTTKEMIAACLGRLPCAGQVDLAAGSGTCTADDTERAAQVFCSYGNFNNTIGLPLMLANLPPWFDYGVFELGMNRPGEVAKMAGLVCPDIAVITNIHPAHIGNFPDIGGIIAAKAEIFTGLVPDGLAIIPAAGEHVAALLAAAHAAGVRRIAFCGVADTPPPLPASITAAAAAGVECTLHTAHRDGEKVVVEISSVFAQRLADASEISLLRFEYNFAQVGEHMLYNSLLAVSVCYFIAPGAEMQLFVANTLAEFTPVAGRGKAIPSRLLPGVTVIDDAYNANPGSVNSSLRALPEYLAQLSGRRMIAVLGDMLELGKFTDELHQSKLLVALEVGISRIYTLGEAQKRASLAIQERFSAVDSASASSSSATTSEIVLRSFDEIPALLAALREDLLPGDVILVKGSAGMKMGSIVAALVEEGAAADLLTKQNP